MSPQFKPMAANGADVSALDRSSWLALRVNRNPRGCVHVRYRAACARSSAGQPCFAVLCSAFWRVQRLPGTRYGIVFNESEGTSPERLWEEGKTGEDINENLSETSRKSLEPSRNATCEDEFLLKACASRQEKLSFCHKNGAACHAHIRDPRYIFFCGEK